MIASIANILITVGMTVLLVVGLHKGATGAVVGNFIGTLAVYLVLLGYRRYQLGLQFDRTLLREMNRFGMPLVPSALALWAINFIDRFFVAGTRAMSEVGVYSLAVRVSSVIVFLMIAFRLAWPAFAYSIDDESRGEAHVLLRAHLPALRLLLDLARARHARAVAREDPRAVEPGVLPRRRGGRRCSRSAPRRTPATPCSRSASAARGRRSSTGSSAASQRSLNIALNFALIPPYGMMGAAISTAAAYVALFVGMTLNSQRVYPVPTSGAASLTLSSVAVALTAIGYEVRSLAARDRALPRLPARAAAARLLPAGGAGAPQAARAAPQLARRDAAGVAHAGADRTGRDEHERETTEHEDRQRRAAAAASASRPARRSRPGRRDAVPCLRACRSSSSAALTLPAPSALTPWPTSAAPNGRARAAIAARIAARTSSPRLE